MGLFGFLGKAIGSVAKAGLSAVTHGVSDKVIGLVKTKPIKARAVDSPLTIQNQAALLKFKPRVLQTESVMAGTPGMKAKPRATRRARKPFRYELVAGDPRNAAMKRRAATRGRGTKTISKATAAKRAGITSRRAPPRGGLDLKAIAASWRAAGKPGSWQAYIKANPIRKA